MEGTLSSFAAATDTSTDASASAVGDSESLECLRQELKLPVTELLLLLPASKTAASCFTRGACTAGAAKAVCRPSWHFRCFWFAAGEAALRATPGPHACVAGTSPAANAVATTAWLSVCSSDRRPPAPQQEVCSWGLDLSAPQAICPRHSHCSNRSGRMWSNEVQTEGDGSAFREQG